MSKMNKPLTILFAVVVAVILGGIAYGLLR